MSSKNKEKYDKIVPDTSIIIEGALSKKIKNKKLELQTLIIHNATLAELEHQANENRVIGFSGLEEIKELQKLSSKEKFTIEFAGQRPRTQEIKFAKLGEIDHLIRELAFEEDATLITGDLVQASVAQAKNIKNVYIKPTFKKKKLSFEKFFDKETMSIHLREDLPPLAKKGLPGQWSFVQLDKKKLTQERLISFAQEIIENAKSRKDGFIEIERSGSTIIQISDYRIVITEPPFSDDWEITIVKPIKKLDFKDYQLSDKLKKRLLEQAEGILVAGSPGHGKTTFARALAEHYAIQEKIVKTVESPRDMLLSPNITQYSITKGNAEEIHDVLLLSRPDHTIFDEMRNTSDFELFADLRLAGIGMVGIVHATNPIDAIQRFLSRLELGVIPQIIDTVCFIQDGQISKVLSLEMVVKVPTGMTEADLARPVVNVTDFENNELLFEIYSYGEQTVIIPVKQKKESQPVQKIAAESIKNKFKKYVDVVDAEVISDKKAIVYVPKKDVPRIIGKDGKRIEKIEDEIGISIDIREIEDIPKKGQEVDFKIFSRKNNIVLDLGSEKASVYADIFIDDQLLLNAKASKRGLIKIKKNNSMGKELQKANKNNISILI